MSNPNDHIISKLSEAITNQFSEDSPERGLINYLRLNPREFANYIIKVFPWPIGVEIRRLFSGDRKERNKERLDQVIRVAEKTAQFFSYVLLAHLWAESKKSKLLLSPDFRRQFKEFDRPSFGVFVGMIRAIHNILEVNNLKPFTNHLENKFFNSKNFFGVIDNLVQARNAEKHNYHESDCKDVEDLLKDFLSNLSFLIKFKLVAVSEIQVFKARLTGAKYKHSMRILNSPHEDFEEEDHDYTEFCESHSILLMKSFETPKEYLNLSPFIIDTSSILRNEKVEGVKHGIYVYNGCKHNKILYYLTSGTEQVPINDLPVYDQLATEFSDLKETLEYEKPV